MIYQVSNDKQQIDCATFFSNDGSRNRIIEPCEAHISAFIRDNLAIFCVVVRTY